MSAAPATTAQPLLHWMFPPLEHGIPHVSLGHWPTPVRRLDNLQTRNAEVWCKEDSVFGDGGWGGNKVRKLEWLIPEAKRRRTSTLLTVGGLGTNWGLATALYAREYGLSTAVALVDQPRDKHVESHLERLRASGATLHFTHNRAGTFTALPWLVMRHSKHGRMPYVLPPGGSSRLGTLGYVEAALELAWQVRAGDLPEPTHIVVAVGSGGTAAGLALGLRLAGLSTRVVGVVVNDTLRLDADTIARLARRTRDLLRQRGATVEEGDIAPGDVDVVGDWLGPGYGHCTQAAERALAIGRDVGLALEPVYTAKALAGLLAMEDQGRFGAGPVLFLNTYGPRPG